MNLRQPYPIKNIFHDKMHLKGFFILMWRYFFVAKFSRPKGQAAQKFNTRLQWLPQ